MSAMTICETPATAISRPPVIDRRPRLLSRALGLVFLSSLGSLTSFYLLLSVVPMYATAAGVTGAGAGLTTGALMLSTVGAELITPSLVARYGYRRVLAGGLVLLGLPALALPFSASMTVILIVCLVRGLGFAITVVVGGALVATLLPAERRGEGLGLFGVVNGVPAVIALPLGVWLVGQVGYAWVFGAGAIAALAGIAAVLGLPSRQPGPQPHAGLHASTSPESDGSEPAFGIRAGLRTPGMLRPSILFAVTAMAGGIVVTFLPVAVTGASGSLVAVALLAQAATATFSRWWAGRYGDRHGAAGLLVPSVLVAAAGMLTLVVTASPVAMVVGMLLFGAGFGAAQNASFSLMLDRVSKSGYGTVSALWNLAYDAGYGVGAAGFGVIAAQTGYSPAFAITAALMLSVLLPIRRLRTAHAAAGQASA